MRTRDEIIHALRANQKAWQEKYLLSRMALFGSVARNETSSDSDVDILVEIDPSIGMRFIDFAEELEQYLECRVDLVSSRSFSAPQWKKIQPELVYVF